jgi:hypothetical protein
MDDLSQKSCCVFDYGYNIPLARRLAREFGRVQFFCPWKDTAPESLKLAVGTGYDDIERIRHWGDAVNSNDLFVFPDIYDGDLQRDLVNRGKRVWGSRRADRLEYDRTLFLQTVEKVGLPVPGYTTCNGIDELEVHLRDTENNWVKCNLRGDDETWHHIKWDFTKRRIEAMRHKYGPIGNDILFTVVENIDSVIEAAYDGFMVTSPAGLVQYSNLGFLGYENKNLSHILRAIPYEDFPDAVRDVNDLFGPELAANYLRSAFGTEIKIVEDEDGDGQQNYFLDATCRQPSPPGEIIMEQVTNLGSFFWHGSEGECIELDIEDEFGVQVLIYSECSESNWSPIEFPPELDRWVKLFRTCKRDDVEQVIPSSGVTASQEGNERIGSVVALGSSIEKAIDKVREYCDEVKGPGLEMKVESLAEVLRRIHEGEEKGIEFADDVPEPESLIEE